MRSRGGHVEAAHRTRRQRQLPASEGRESNRRVTPRTVQGTQDPRQSSLSGDDRRYARAMGPLRVWIRALTAILVAGTAHASIDGLTIGLALALALTGVLLVAALRFRRLGSRVPANAVSARAAAAREQTSNGAPTLRHRDGEQQTESPRLLTTLFRDARPAAGTQVCRRSARP